MNCEKWSEVLSEYIDQTLPEELSLQVAAHLKACPACLKLERELRQLRNMCREMKDVPARTANWAAIQRRLVWQGLVSPKQTILPAKELFAADYLYQQVAFYRRLAFGSIAACLLMLGFGIGAFWIYRLQPQTEPFLSAKQLEVQLAVMQLQKAIANTALLFEQSKMEWQPEVRKVVETNLAALDQAIAESRRALLNDPGSEEAGLYLIQACQKKLAVLNSVLNMNGI